MRDRPTARPPGRLRGGLRDRRRPRGRAADAGFGLVEVMVAMFILVSLSVATTPFFVHALADTSGQAERQDAVSVATQRIELVRSVAASTLLRGRTAADVATRLTNDPGLVDLSQDDTTNTATHPNSDGTSTDPLSANAEVPVLTTTVLAQHTFTVRTFIDPCYRSSADGTCTKDSSHGAAILRVTADVSWPRPAADSCTSGRPGQCEYVLVSLRDPSGDPVFNSNVSAPMFDLPPYTATNLAAIVPSTTLHPLMSAFDSATAGPGAGTPVAIQLNGKNFLSGATLASSDTADVVGAISSNTGTQATVTYQPSAVNGEQRVLRLTNPDGGNDATTLTVVDSAPTLTAVTAAGVVTRGTAASFVVVGSDLFTSSVTPASFTVVLTQKAAPKSSTMLVATGTAKVVLSPTAATFSLTVPTGFPAGAATAVVTETNPDGVGTTSYTFTVVVA